MMSQGHKKADKKAKKKQQSSRAGRVPARPLVVEGVSVRAMVFPGAIVAIVTFLVYLPALSNGFVSWDDGRYVYENQNIRSLDLSFLWWTLTSVVLANWHPITLISYGIDYAIWGLNPRGYHLTNIIFHAFNVLLVFILTLRLAGLTMPRDTKEKTAFGLVSKGALIAAAVAALFFGLHPLRVESVVWVSERKDVLCAFFFLLSLLSYFEYVRATSKKALFYGATLLFFILALMSKPMAITLPLVLLILDWYPLGRWRFGVVKRVIIEKVPFLALSIVSAILTLWIQKSAGAVSTLEVVSPIKRMLVGLKAYIFYLYKTILPFDLAPFYPYPEVIYLVSIEYLGSIICFIVISLSCVLLLKKSRAFSALWLYYLITLLPVIGIVQVGAQAAADRYTYLPLLGLGVFAGIGIGRLYDKGLSKEYATAIFALTVSVLVFFSYRTILQERIWRDSLTLWSHEVELHPHEAPLPRYNLGLAYYKLEQMDKAAGEFKEALRMNPDYADAHNYLGAVYYDLGRTREAMKEFEETLRLDPKHADARNRLGAVYYDLGRIEEAMEEFKETLRLDPEHIDAHNNVGVIYAERGRLEEAVKEFLAAQKSDPKSHDAYKNLGLAYALLGRLDDAVTQYKEAIRLKPDYADAHFNLGLAYNAKGLKDEAERELRKALEIQPGFSAAKKALESLSK